MGTVRLTYLLSQELLRIAVFLRGWRDARECDLPHKNHRMTKQKAETMSRPLCEQRAQGQTGVRFE